MVQTATWVDYRVPDTLMSDSEESVVGTQWHQEASAHLMDLLQAVAERRAEPWGVCMWIALSGLRHADGTTYDPMPDVMVLRQALPRIDVAEVRLDEVEAPLFIAEVASKSTKNNDLREKRQAYAAIGVPEYIVFDAVGGLLRVPLLAWRLEGGRYVAWESEPDGWWHSAALEVSLRLDGLYMRVRDDRDGTEIPLSRVAREMAREEGRLRAAEAERRAALERQLIAEAERRAAEAERRAALERQLIAEAERRAALERRIADLEQRRQAPED